MNGFTKCLSAVIWISAVQCASSQVIVSRATTITVAEQEPLALKKAAADLASDMQKVFGTSVRIVHNRADAGSSTIVISSSAFRSRKGSPAKQPEILQIRTLNTGSKRQAVLLTGSDMRGVIYAVYQFSQQFLGVDPMYFWTDMAPRPRELVTVPAGFFLQDGPPTFTHRGFFINDEDLLTGWRPGDKDGTDIAMEIWDKVYETILRLKGDMVIPGSDTFPDEPQMRLAQARGLIISQHHIEVLGTPMGRWPASEPYSFTSHPELFVSAWTHSVEAYAPDQEVIWTLGYRGRSDRPFWADDPAAGTTDAEHAAVIQRAIAAQMKILKDENRNEPMIMNAWQEMVPLLEKNLLHVPPGATLVWPDDGWGNLRDGGRIAKGEGVYYHTAMFNTMANQLTEAIPLDRIQHELGRAAAAGATQYLMINTSDIRPVVMTTQAAMELGWNAKPWLENPKQSDLFLLKWAGDHYGAKAAPNMEEYYKTFFRAPSRFAWPTYPQISSEPTLPLEENGYHTLARLILVNLIKGAQPAKGANAYVMGHTALFEKLAAEEVPRWEQLQTMAQQAAPLISPRGKDLFQAHVLTQLGFDLNSNEMLLEVCKAAQEQAPEEGLNHIEKAIAYIQAALRSLHSAEFGKWTGFYKGDITVDARQTLALAEGYRDLLQGKPLPKGLAVAVYPRREDDVLSAYQGSRVVATH